MVALISIHILIPHVNNLTDLLAELFNLGTNGLFFLLFEQLLSVLLDNVQALVETSLRPNSHIEKREEFSSHLPVALHVRVLW